MSTEFKAILFDIGSTLRIPTKDENYSNNSKIKLVELLGIDTDPYEYCEFLDCRYEGYRKWAFDKMKEASEEELWTRWMIPEFPKDFIKEKANELTNLYRNVKGPRFLVENGREVITGLNERGYTLGIISNLISETEIPAWLEEEGFTPYFKTVVLSAVCGLRKPDPQIYLEAARQIGIPPEQCVYIGDNLDRDVTGAKAAGYGMTIIFISPEKLAKKKITDANRPNAIIHEFKEILDLFPDCPNINLSAIRKP